MVTMQTPLKIFWNTFLRVAQENQFSVHEQRKMDKEVVVLMYNGISLSHEINVIRLVAAR